MKAASYGLSLVLAALILAPGFAERNPAHRKHPGGGQSHVGASLRSLLGKERTRRIAGGSDAPRYRFPYMGTLRDDLGEFCGGVLIYSNWVLTAAHCLYPYDVAGNLFFAIGAYETDYAPGTPGVEEISVRNINIHPGYISSGQIDDDIALIELDWDSSYPTITLPYARGVNVDEIVLVLGYGGYGEGSAVLEQAYMYVIDMGICEVEWGYLGPSYVCAKADGVDTCEGDSGGPLLIADPNGDPSGDILVGITSFGEDECDISTAAGVYSRVDYYLDWIASV